MRARIKGSWRTRLLLLLAVIASGIIAWFQVEHRMQEQARERTARRPPPTEARDAGTVVEIELAP